jgi:hypothetical protein
MELQYIKTKNGDIFRPQKAGVTDESKICSNYPVCIIKKLLFGMYQIDYFDEFNVKGYHSFGQEDKPNTRLILYPSGIEEIKYKI